MNGLLYTSENLIISEAILNMIMNTEYFSELLRKIMTLFEGIAVNLVWP